MIDLENHIRELRPERSLLMTYSLSLVHFERNLLDALQERGAGQVSLLVDPRAYETSFSERSAVSGPGMDYRLAAVNLPRAQASFHPKLYLFLHEEGVTLFVASANLTLPGCRTNAEIVDQVTISASGRGDTAAIADYLDLLEALVALDPSLPSPIRSELEGIADELLPLVGSPTANGPRLLHTLRRDLISQVREQIPAAEVEEVVLISPFFDAESRAILEIARTYPTARLRLIRKDQDPTDLNGAALAPIADRLTVENFQMVGAENEKRPLHAKLALFRGQDRAWLVAGSANLTAPAWLRSAADFGNAEAVTLRVSPDPRGFDGLLEALGPLPVELSSLRYVAEEQDDSSPTDFVISEIRVEPNGVVATIRLLDPRWSAARFILRYETDAEIPPVDFQVQADDHAGILILRAPPESTHALGDAPVVAAVDAVLPSGERASSRAWLERPIQLRLSATDRAYRRATLALERRGLMTEPENLLALSDLLHRFASEVSQAIDPTTRGHAPTTGAPERDGPTSGTSGATSDRLIPRTTAGEGGSSAGGGGGSGMESFVHQLVAGLRRGLLARMDEGDPDLATPTDRGTAGRARAPSSGSAGGNLEARYSVPVTPILQLPSFRRADLAAVDGKLSESVPLIGECELKPEKVVRVATVVTALSQFFFHLYIHRASTGEEDRTHFLQQVARVLEQAFSIEGFGYGDARGWFVRAWMNPSTRAEVERVWTDPGRSLWIASLLGTVFALLYGTGSDKQQVSRTQNIRAGFDLVAHRGGQARDTMWMAHLQEHARGISAYPHTPDPAEIVQGVLGSSEAQAPVVQLATRLLPLIQHQETGADLGAVDPSDRRAKTLRDKYERIRKSRPPAIVPLIPTGDRLGCGRCRIALSATQSADANRADNFSSCEYCGRILVPFNVQDEGVRAVLDRLLPQPEAESV